MFLVSGLSLGFDGFVIESGALLFWLFSKRSREGMIIGISRVFHSIAWVVVVGSTVVPVIRAFDDAVYYHYYQQQYQQHHKSRE